MDYLSPKLLSAVKKMGFSKLTPVQEQSIPLIKQGKNLLVQSKTGTGKTAAFAMPILESLKENKKLQVVVIEPTRELAIQVGNDFRKIGAELNFGVVVAYGGTPDDRQKKLLADGANILVGTQDRVLDLISSGDAKLSNVSVIVLDEADVLLGRDMFGRTNKIMHSVPANCQKLFFCVHLPKALEETVEKMLVSFEKVKTFAGEDKRVDELKHDVVFVDSADKFKELCKLLESSGKTIVFCKTKDSCTELNQSLIKKGFLDTRIIHGDFDQTRRNSAIASFKKNIRILVATDVVARGLHVPGVDLVINYELPQNYDYYLHRIGRTGRMSIPGRVVTLVSPEDSRRWKEIKNKAGITE
ncbi:DEAD/DEAH box helicase [Candidatus Micrarchaeota archaeon]|nr:DEAD/DEAH box helicase [Candidatus Micrarchaeota archaeon]